jgi:glycosyltransferase involved in cell wall biosynthesis
VLLQTGSFTQGGLEQVVIDLAEGLRARGAEVTLLVVGEAGSDAERARRRGIDVVHLRKAPAAAAYEDLVRRFEVVSAHDSVVGAEVAARARVPFVQTLHNCYVWFQPERVAEYRAADAHTSAYAAVSAQALMYADLRLGLDVGKAVLVPNGIDTARSPAPGDARRLRAELGLGPRDFVFLNVASIYPPKAQHIAVRAIARANGRHSDRTRDRRLKLVLLGRALDSRYADIVRAEAEAAGIGDAVVFAGYREDPAPFYAMADAFVLPSYVEGCSLAALEATNAGLPLVLSDVGAAREQLALAGGRLVAPPFTTITDLDWTTLGRWVNGVQQDYVERLAEAMAEVAEDGAPRRPPAPAVAAMIDRGVMAQRYDLLLRWLRQGGTAAAMRPLLARAQQTSQGWPAARPPAIMSEDLHPAETKPWPPP